jgi:hypothetical protein
MLGGVGEVKKKVNILRPMYLKVTLDSSLLGELSGEDEVDSLWIISIKNIHMPSHTTNKHLTNLIVITCP